jgi:hypothetical protein
MFVVVSSTWTRWPATSNALTRLTVAATCLAAFGGRDAIQPVETFTPVRSQISSVARSTGTC